MKIKIYLQDCHTTVSVVGSTDRLKKVMTDNSYSILSTNSEFNCLEFTFPAIVHKRFNSTRLIIKKFKVFNNARLDVNNLNLLICCSYAKLSNDKRSINEKLLYEFEEE